MNIPGRFFQISRFKAAGVFIALAFALLNACSVAEGPNAHASTDKTNTFATTANSSDAKSAAIDIAQGGPADTVRAFYRDLRARKFREAIFLTNLRPAVEGLTDIELKDFAVDFETLAGQVPADLEINGEIISGDHATVTANLPGEDG